ncbi:MAG: hypothetical protein FHP92_10670 [Denitromonas halophila]|nr:MAG: hypothetical protein FHP92_10670 [Denitromonas halophila]
MPTIAVQNVANLRLGLQERKRIGPGWRGVFVQRLAQRLVARHVGGKVFDLVSIQGEIGAQIGHALVVELARLLNDDATRDVERRHGQQRERHDAGQQQIPQKTDGNTDPPLALH